MLCLALLTCLLTLSTFIHFSEGFFATFIIATAIALAGCGAYLQTSVVAVASLFGPTVIQSLISGQAVVAVILSAVQLISATGSLHTSRAGPALPDGVAETKSARLFFGISTSFLFACGAANAWMTRLPSFKAVVPDDEPWIRRRLSLSADPRSPRSPSVGSPHLGAPDSKANWDRILSVARRNILYEIAVAYVFMTTLVSCPAFLFNQHVGCNMRYSQSFPPSQYRLSPSIRRSTRSCSVHSTSSSSILATGLDDTFAVSRDFSSGVQENYLLSRLPGHSSFRSSWRVTFIATLRHPQHRPSSIQMCYTCCYYSLWGSVTGTCRHCARWLRHHSSTIPG